MIETCNYDRKKFRWLHKTWKIRSFPKSGYIDLRKKVNKNTTLDDGQNTRENHVHFQIKNNKIKNLKKISKISEKISEKSEKSKILKISKISQKSQKI